VRNVRHGQVGGLQIPVTWAPQDGFRPLEIHQGPLLLRCPLVYKIDFQTRLVSDLFHVPEFVHALIAEGDPQRADLAPSWFRLLVALELRKRFYGPHRKFGPFDAVADLPDQAGRLWRGHGR
jgi:hypothetical protein